MEKCKECKYWDWGSHECFHPDNRNIQDENDFKFRVRWCGPEFGCIHHKKGHPGDYLTEMEQLRNREGLSSGRAELHAVKQRTQVRGETPLVPLVPLDDIQDDIQCNAKAYEITMRNLLNKNKENSDE